MKLFKKLGAIFTLALIILTASFNSANAFTAKVLKVYDGDTFKVFMEGENVTIRLYGIDAPERGQNGNVSATRFLKRSIVGNLLEIRVLEEDWTGRLHAIVNNLGYGKSVNAAMVANGYSWVHPQQCTIDECSDWQELESSARKYRLGIWAGFSLVPPWEFKREGD